MIEESSLAETHGDAISMVNGAIAKVLSDGEPKPRLVRPMTGVRHGAKLEEEDASKSQLLRYL